MGSVWSTLSFYTGMLADCDIILAAMEIECSEMSIAENNVSSGAEFFFHNFKMGKSRPLDASQIFNSMHSKGRNTVPLIC